MEIKLDENKLITGYATVGSIEGIEIDEEILPEDFFEVFDVGYYMYTNENITVNPNYKKVEFDYSSLIPKEKSLTMLQNLVSQQSTQIVQLQERLTQLEGGSKDE